MTLSLTRFRESLPAPLRDRLRDVANRLLPYRGRFATLYSETQALRAAQAERDGVLRTLRVMTADQAQHLLRLGEQNRLLADASLTEAQRIAQLQRCNDELQAVKLAHQNRIAALDDRIAALTAAAVAREQKLEGKANLDYQMLMIHQQLLAEFTDAEPEFRDFYELCKPFTMTSIERLYSLYKSVEYISEARVPGDLVECGVWRGGSCMMMAMVLLSHGESNRPIVMFDTFEGHPPPDPERDVDLWGNCAFEEWRQQTHDGKVKGWGRAPLDDVRDNLQSTGYPSELLRYVKGMVEETAPHNVPEQLALLRLDTDWYASTRAALLHLYPRLVPGGVLILDDYGHYRGQRQAVDEYLDAAGEKLLFHRVDYSCRVAIKR
jgi:O-methyltransferase